MQTVLTNLIPLMSFLALSVSSAVAQNAPQFIARQDITLSGSTVVLAGELINSVAVNGSKVTMSIADGQQAEVNRSDLANIDEAVGVLSTLIQKDPQNARLYSARSNVWAVKKDFAKAIEDATSAIEAADPQNATLYVNRGVFYSSTGDYNKAAADYVKATHINPKTYSAYRNLAIAHVARKQYQKAVDVCTQIINVDDDNPEYYIQRGVANRHLEKWDDAIADFTKALELKPENLAALGSRGFVNYLKGDHATAVKDFAAIIKLTPDDAMAYNNRGYNAFLSGDSKQALADYDKAVSLLPAYATAWQNKAWLLATTSDDAVRDGEAAIAAAKQAAGHRQAKHPADFKALAAGYAETGNFEKAIEHQRSAVDMVAEDKQPAEKAILADYEAQKPFRTTTAEPQPE